MAFGVSAPSPLNLSSLFFSHGEICDLRLLSRPCRTLAFKILADKGAEEKNRAAESKTKKVQIKVKCAFDEYRTFHIDIRHRHSTSTLCQVLQDAWPGSWLDVVITARSIPNTRINPCRLPGFPSPISGGSSRWLHCAEQW